ncbi:hypothetical protein K3G64_19765 [Mycobacterium sp. IDR2000157661]|nr:hypothetical protein K3G64_19765 [Mycobacterium sp. IDR2000157661]
MDLIFDSQVRSHRRSGELPEPVLASIAGYYRRATTAARPMNYLVAAVMVLLLSVVVIRWVDAPGWPLVIPSLLAGAPILLAAVRTVPSAKRLGSRVDSAAAQSFLARGVFRDHLLCLAAMTTFLVVWIAHY